MLGTMTVREVISMSARLRLPPQLSVEEKMQRVDQARVPRRPLQRASRPQRRVAREPAGAGRLAARPFYPLLSSPGAGWGGARLRGGCPSTRLARREQVIQILHLESCADTVMGYQGERGGISGGERKRTGIAIELITNPSVQPRPRPRSGDRRCADAGAAAAGHLPGRAHLGTGYLHGALGLCDAQTGSHAASSRATPLRPAPRRCAPSLARAARR